MIPTAFLRQRKRENNRHGGGDDKWRRYEQLKEQWIAAHPGATPAEYTAAMARISRQCGV